MIESSASMLVTQKVNALKAAVKKVYKFSIGDTHFAPPLAIRNKLEEGIANGYSHYTDAHGIPELRELISKKYDGLSSENVLITPGVKQGLYYTFMSLKEKRVVAVEPTWLGYRGSIQLTGNHFLSINRLQPDWLDQLTQLDFDALLVCSPNNPDGCIISPEEANTIHEIVKSKEALLFVDEIYQAYNYANQPSAFIPFYNSPAIVVFDGFSKSHACTGLRVGYMLTTNEPILDHACTLQQNIATCPSSIAQYAMLASDQVEDELAEFKSYYFENRALVAKRIPEFEKFQSQGGFYYFIDVGTFGFADGGLFCQDLLDATGVALVPGEAYGADFKSWARMSFSIDREELSEGLDQLKSFIISHK